MDLITSPGYFPGTFPTSKPTPVPTTPGFTINEVRCGDNIYDTYLQYAKQSGTCELGVKLDSGENRNTRAGGVVLAVEEEFCGQTTMFFPAPGSPSSLTGTSDNGESYFCQALGGYGEKPRPVKDCWIPELKQNCKIEESWRCYTDICK